MNNLESTPHLYHSSTPSLAMSLLSQGNNGSFNKPFAKKYGLYAAIMLSELIYLQDLFIHKKGKGMVVQDNDGNDFIGFFRSYDDLHTATSIPPDTIKRKGNAKNPLNILRNLGIIKTASTTVGESFKRVLVYMVIPGAVHEHISIATEEYYYHINTKRVEEERTTQVEMTPIRSKRGPISDKNQPPHSLSCGKHTTVENKGLQSDLGTNKGKIEGVTEKAQSDQTELNTIQGVCKPHPSNTTNHPLTNTNPTGVTTKKHATSGTNHQKEEVNVAAQPKSSIEREYSQEVIDTLYANHRAIYGPKIAELLENFFIANTDSITAYEDLIKYTGLPANYRASNKDMMLLHNLRDKENSLAYTEAFSDKIIRNAVLIRCGKRRKAFGQLFVGINMKDY